MSRFLVIILLFLGFKSEAQKNNSCELEFYNDSIAVFLNNDEFGSVNLLEYKLIRNKLIVSNSEKEYYFFNKQTTDWSNTLNIDSLLITISIKLKDTIEEGGITCARYNLNIDGLSKINVLTQLDKGKFGYQFFYLKDDQVPVYFDLEIQSTDKLFIHKTNIDRTKFNTVNIEYYCLFSIEPINENELKKKLPKIVILNSKKYKVKYLKQK